jgi:hypothetical protein
MRAIHKSNSKRTSKKAGENSLQVLDPKIAEFCRKASHELGNVLGTIVGELDYGLTNTNSLVRYRAMNVALMAAERAISLARNLAYFAAHPQLKIQTTDIGQLLQDTAEMVEKELLGKRIKIKLSQESSSLLLLDPGAIQQVVLNLLRRAADSMPQGGNVSILLKQTGGKIEIFCQDTGVGIPASLLRQLNGDQPFSDEEEGSLELAVAKTLIEKQKGTLTAKSKQGTGTTFKLSFPVSVEIDPETGSREHRRYRRVKTALPVEVSFREQNPFMTEIETLSVKGCFIVLADPSFKELPPVDSTGSLRIYYYQDQILDIASCRIASHSPKGLGIEFLEFDSRAQKLLEAIVKSHSFE